MNIQHSIGIIVPWFGHWPAYLDYFLLSCRNNPTVNWIIPADQDSPERKPDNVRFVSMTLEELNKRISRSLDLKTDIRFPYKLCDLKPAYGMIFKDLIEEFDFWGYGDLDLMYGDIRKFHTPADLDKYELFSNHKEFVTGHFCLLKNSQKMNELFMNGGSYRDAFMKKGYTGFDELIRTKPISADPENLKHFQIRDRSRHIRRFRRVREIGNLVPAEIRSGIRNKTRNKLHDFSSIVEIEVIKGNLKARYSETFESDLMLEKRSRTEWTIRYNNGKLFGSTEKELLYFHFIQSKYSDSFSIPELSAGTPNLEISRSGIKETRNEG